MHPFHHIVCCSRAQLHEKKVLVPVWASRTLTHFSHHCLRHCFRMLFLCIVWVENHCFRVSICPSRKRFGGERENCAAHRYLGTSHYSCSARIFWLQSFRYCKAFIFSLQKYLLFIKKTMTGYKNTTVSFEKTLKW